MMRACGFTAYEGPATRQLPGPGLGPGPGELLVAVRAAGGIGVFATQLARRGG